MYKITALGNATQCLWGRQCCFCVSDSMVETACTMKAIWCKPHVVCACMCVCVCVRACVCVCVHVCVCDVVSVINEQRSVLHPGLNCFVSHCSICSSRPEYKNNPDYCPWNPLLCLSLSLSHTHNLGQWWFGRAERGCRGDPVPSEAGIQIRVHHQRSSAAQHSLWLSGVSDVWVIGLDTFGSSIVRGRDCERKRLKERGRERQRETQTGRNGQKETDTEKEMMCLTSEARSDGKIVFLDSQKLFCLYEEWLGAVLLLQFVVNPPEWTEHTHRHTHSHTQTHTHTFTHRHTHTHTRQWTMFIEAKKTQMSYWRACSLLSATLAQSCSPPSLLWPGLHTATLARSEERRVGKACRSRWAPSHSKKKKKSNPYIRRGYKTTIVSYR